MILSKSFKSIATDGTPFRNIVFYLDDKYSVPAFQIEQIHLSEEIIEGEKVIRKFWNKYLLARAISVKEDTMFKIINIVDDVYKYLSENKTT